MIDFQETFGPPVESHQWRYIVLHHSATVGGNVAAIDAAHRNRKDQFSGAWLGIGYHFVIGNGNGMPDGQVEATFRWDEQAPGAHTSSPRYNLDGIGICLVGDFELAPPTVRQISSTEQLCQWLFERFAILKKNVVRHHDVAATRCPGRLFPYGELLDYLPTDSVVTGGSRAVGDI
ncbi:MAG: peptidoglycan recognition family protein [Pirellulales bacterium]